jgi:hypothetical protein
VILDKLERNKDIKHKHGKKIYVIKRFVINVLWKGIISCFLVYAEARLDMCEKSIIFRSVAFQNLVHKSCNTRHVTHLQVDHTPRNLDGNVD